jgi:hypothetical protein
LAWIDVDLAVRRPGLQAGLGIALLVGALLVYALVVAPLNTRIEASRIEHARVVRAAAELRTSQVPAKSVDDERLAAFLDVLGERQELTVFLGTVFEQAKKRALSLAQADYKYEHDNAGQFDTYQMTLPLKGEYPRLRGFIDATLARIPCAAIEEVSFRRDAIGAAQTEARLRLLFFLRPEKS